MAKPVEAKDQQEALLVAVAETKRQRRAAAAKPEQFKWWPTGTTPLQ